MIKSSIKYPVTVIVGVLIACISGMIALNKVPIQLTPEVKRPAITVSTSWFGASPEEIEREIIEEQEEYLKSVEGLLKMNSQSSQSSGSITLEFPVGTDITAAVVKVTNKLNQVPSYPTNADRPVVSTSGPFDNAIAWFVVKGDSGIYVPHKQKLIEDLVKPRLERVQGVASINIFGGLEEELQVIFNPDLLASTGITIAQLSQALRSENRDVSAGDFGEGKRRYIVRTISRYESIEAVEQTVVAMKNSVPIRVGDIAEVKLGFRKPTAKVRHKGTPGLAFNAQRQIGANVLEVTAGLQKELININRDILAPHNLEVQLVYTETVYINSAVDLVFNNLFLGGFLAILVLFMFLRSFSSIMVIAVSIPISIITTFLTMYLFGRTINVVSLAGMAFAVGMVVDSAIVVLENIYRHLQMGKKRYQAAYDGTREVWGALLASTITTVAVFLPILFVQARAGQLFKDIAIAISSAIAISLIVSVTVIPSLSSRILKSSKKLHGKQGEGKGLDREANRIANWVDWVNQQQLRRFVVIIGIVTICLGLTVTLLPDQEYLPNGNQNFVFGFMLPPPGYNLGEVEKAGINIEKQLHHLWEKSDEESLELPGGGVDNFFFVAFPGSAIMGMTAREPSRISELLPLANQAIYSIPGTFGIANQASIFGGGFAGTRSVRIDITGPELTKVLPLALSVFGKIGEVLPGANSRPDPGLDLGSPEIHVYPDRVRAADVGFTAVEIGQTVNALIDGSRVAEYWNDGSEIDLLIKGRDDWSKYTQNVDQLPLATATGEIITLADVARIEQHQGPIQINHVERQRTVSILTGLPDDIPLEVAMQKIENEIVGPMRAEGQLGGLYDIRLAGTADDLSQLQGEFQTNFILAILLTYLLLAALFQSFTYPLVVMFTVPLATFGGVLGLQLVRLFDSSQQLDILTLLGFVILVGTVINNSILIVYHALHKMEEGFDPKSAVKESVRVRVRPILMSTGTSALGMLPLVLMPGAGSELYRGLGAVVVGGLVLSSVITLFLTPLVFSLSLELTEKFKSMIGYNASASDLEGLPEN